MATTRLKISSQVLRRLSGGNPSQATKWKHPEIYEAIAQVLNKLLKIDHLQVTMPLGGTVPDGLVLATYENIAVEQFRNVSRCTLPAIPIRLPNDMGLFFVGPNVYGETTDNILNCQYIPVPSGHSVLLKDQPMISDLLGQAGYERRGKEVWFTRDITTGTDPVSAVVVQLAVLDMSQYGDFDLLPIPADMEADCVNQVVEMLKGEPPADKITDPVKVSNV